MTDTTHCIPDDVLARAAEAIHNASIYAGCACETCQQEAMAASRAALPILIPAIEAALVERMIADADGIEAVRVGYSYHRYTDLANWLRSYLPATTEGATDHD